MNNKGNYKLLVFLGMGHIEENEYLHQSFERPSGEIRCMHV